MSKLNYSKQNSKRKASKKWHENRQKSIEKQKEREAKRKEKAKKKVFLKGVAKNLQKNTPKSEVWFYKYLEDAQLSDYFKKNVPLCGLIPDLSSIELKIVIEVDGSIHNRPDIIRKDARNTERYNRAGFRVLRVKHGDEEQALEVLKIVKKVIHNPSEEVVIEAKKLSKEEELAAIKRILGNTKGKKRFGF